MTEYQILIQRQDDKCVIFNHYLHASNARQAREAMRDKLRDRFEWGTMRVLGVRSFPSVKQGQFEA